MTMNFARKAAIAVAMSRTESRRQRQRCRREGYRRYGRRSRTVQHGLAAALDAAGLVETLKGPGPFTVFAPTDEAFSELPAGTVESLLKPENKEKLVGVLTYHVVPGSVSCGCM